MIQHVKVILFDENLYWSKDANTAEMSILGNFLTSDVGCYTPGFKEGILDDNCRGLGGNYSCLEKDGDFILISEETESMKPQYPFLKVHKSELVRLLDEWEKICKEKPQEVLITFDGERFTIETKQ